MSKSPNPFAGKLPTGLVRVQPLSRVLRHGKSGPSQVLAMIRPSGRASSPHVNTVPSSPPRAAYSHSASVGSAPPDPRGVRRGVLVRHVHHRVVGAPLDRAAGTLGCRPARARRPGPPLAQVAQVDGTAGRREHHRARLQVLRRRPREVARVERTFGHRGVAGSADERGELLRWSPGRRRSRRRRPAPGGPGPPPGSAPPSPWRTRRRAGSPGAWFV